jgi:hypothetical protein
LVSFWCPVAVQLINRSGSSQASLWPIERTGATFKAVFEPQRPLWKLLASPISNWPATVSFTIVTSVARSYPTSTVLMAAFFATMRMSPKCETPPNQSMERTAARLASTLCVATTRPSTHALGGGRSSLSR